MTNERDHEFLKLRGMLFGLAYRMLGSRADAEDAVQDTFIRWHEGNREHIDNIAAYLTTICTNRCVDILRSAHKVKVDYVGNWLPEPIETSMNEQDTNIELSSSLSTAFMLILERLAPKERAAYLLHDVFDLKHAEVASALGVSESACRKLVSRARLNVAGRDTRQAPTVADQDALLAAFATTLRTGDVSHLASRLVEDVRLTADGGGKVPTISEILTGKTQVLEFVASSLREFWAEYSLEVSELNGLQGLLLTSGGTVRGAITFDYSGSDSDVVNIFIVRNPDKLQHLQASNDRIRF